MKFSIILLICQLVFIGKNFSQTEFPLKLILEENQKKFTPIEPISLKILLTNPSTQRLEVLSIIPDSGNPHIEYLAVYQM
jgi:hypothetical protein